MPTAVPRWSSRQIDGSQSLAAIWARACWAMSTNFTADLTPVGFRAVIWARALGTTLGDDGYVVGAYYVQVTLLEPAPA